MARRIRRDRWNTYRITGYVFDAANDQRSAGGIHDHQVRRGPAGWQTRIRQVNGLAEAFGCVQAITVEEGERLFEQAKYE